MKTSLGSQGWRESWPLQTLTQNSFSQGLHFPCHQKHSSHSPSWSMTLGGCKVGWGCMQCKSVAKIKQAWLLGIAKLLIQPEYTTNCPSREVHPKHFLMGCLSSCSSVFPKQLLDSELSELETLLALLFDLDFATFFSFFLTCLAFLSFLCAFFFLSSLCLSVFLKQKGVCWL